MAKINIDQIIHQLSRPPVDQLVLTIGDKDYTVRHLTVAEVLRLESVSLQAIPEGATDAQVAAANAEADTRLREVLNVFDGDAPALVDEFNLAKGEDRIRASARITFVVAMIFKHFAGMINVGNRVAEALKLAAMQSTSSQTSS